MTLADKHIGFIGGGAMAEALAGGLLGAGVAAEQIRVAEPRAERRDQLREVLGVTCGDDNAELVRECDLLVLAVKPDVVASVLSALANENELDLGLPLWISIAAGVTTEALGAGLGVGSRIVRAMPNTPALVQAGATAIVGNDRATAADLDAAGELFRGVGIVWAADDETQLDAVTGLSGSGPAYAFLFLEALIDAGVGVGLPPEAAQLLVFQTVYGAAKLAIESERSPSQLRNQVAAPGGTTVAGLKQLEDGGLRETLKRAVEAATRRSTELGKP